MIVFYSNQRYDFCIFCCNKLLFQLLTVIALRSCSQTIHTVFSSTCALTTSTQTHNEIWSVHLCPSSWQGHCSKVPWRRAHIGDYNAQHCFQIVPVAVIFLVVVVLNCPSPCTAHIDRQLRRPFSYVDVDCYLLQDYCVLFVYLCS